MKILTFCAYYEPEIAASMYLLTNLFEDATKAGIEVEVFAPTPTRGVDTDTILKYKKNKCEKQFGGKLKIHRIWMFQEGKNPVGRALRYILLDLAFVFKGLLTSADVIFIDSTPPTQGLVAAILKKLKRIPVVYNLQDIFPDSLVNTGLSKDGSIVYKIGSWIEKVTYVNADRIIVISEDFRSNIMRKGVPADRIEVVYNWVDENAVHFIPRNSNRLFDRYEIDRGKFYVSYCGNIGLTQNMELLITVAERLKDDKRIGFIIVGNGAYRDELERLVSSKGLNNVYMLPFQDYKYISEVFSLGDIGLIISKPGIGTNSVPSKTWSYMAAGRPIISSFDMKSELVSIISENNCGISVAPNNADELVEAIRRMENDREAIVEQGANCRKFIDKNLTRTVGTGKYIKCLRDACE